MQELKPRAIKLTIKQRHNGKGYYWEFCDARIAGIIYQVDDKQAAFEEARKAAMFEPEAEPVLYIDRDGNHTLFTLGPPLETTGGSQDNIDVTIESSPQTIGLNIAPKWRGAGWAPLDLPDIPVGSAEVLRDQLKRACKAARKGHFVELSHQLYFAGDDS